MNFLYLDALIVRVPHQQTGTTNCLDPLFSKGQHGNESIHWTKRILDQMGPMKQFQAFALVLVGFMRRPAQGGVFPTWQCVLHHQESSHPYQTGNVRSVIVGLVELTCSVADAHNIRKM